MTAIGYARVSTTDQDLSIQEAALRSAGCDMIRAEKQSGTRTQGRTELWTVLDFIGKGDVLLVTRIDRLARSIGDLQNIVRTLKAKGAGLRATEQHRHEHRCRYVLPRHARGVRGIRDQLASRAPARRDRKSQGGRCL